MATAAPSAPPVPKAETPARILDAAFECVRDVGLGRTTMEDVARAAGVSRQTVYRYFPSKEQLVTALVLREEERFLDGIRAAFAAQAGLQPALRDGILFCLRFARRHPLLDRLLATDPETLLPYLTVRATPLIVRARQVLRTLLAQKAWVRADLLESTADALVRVVISHALTPGGRRSEDVADGLARIATMALTGKEGSRT